MQKNSPQGVVASYLKLLRISRAYIFYFIFGVLSIAVVSSVDSLAAYFLKPLIDNGLLARNISFVKWLPLLVILIFLIRGLATVTANYSLNAVSRNVVMHFRQRLYRTYVSLTCGFFDKNNTGSLISKVIYNVDQVSSACSTTILTLIRESVLLLGLCIVMFSVSWRLSLIVFTVFPLIALILKYCSRRMRKITANLQTAMSGVTVALDSGFRGVRVIKMALMEKACSQSFDKITANARRQEMKIVVTNSFSSGAVQFIIGFPLALIIYLSFQSYIALTAGGFAAFMTAVIGLGRPLRRLTSINSAIQQGVVASNSIFDVLDLPAEPDCGQYEPNSIRGVIEYHSVSHSFDASEGLVLDNINFKVNAGETFALVGHSGAGKTTLVNLMPRLYQPNHGSSITLDGVDICDYKLSSLRSSISYVSQVPFLFDDTIINNVKFARPDATDEQVCEALKFAHLFDFVTSLPRGLDTMVGQDGMQLSGGQRQRIVLARAFLKDAPILILDEATSALDTQSERYIQDSLQRLMQGRTTIVIAHRLSTVETADQILVMDQGRVVEQGSHVDLLGQSGVYASLYAMQFGSITAAKEVAC
jgi:ATP-binding cassette, subfamily B, bacterial MsbA